MSVCPLSIKDDSAAPAGYQRAAYRITELPDAWESLTGVRLGVTTFRRWIRDGAGTEETGRVRLRSTQPGAHLLVKHEWLIELLEACEIDDAFDQSDCGTFPKTSHLVRHCCEEPDINFSAMSAEEMSDYFKNPDKYLNPQAAS